MRQLFLVNSRFYSVRGEKKELSFWFNDKKVHSFSRINRRDMSIEDLVFRLEYLIKAGIVRG